MPTRRRRAKRDLVRGKRHRARHVKAVIPYADLSRAVGLMIGAERELRRRAIRQPSRQPRFLLAVELDETVLSRAVRYNTERRAPQLSLRRIDGDRILEAVLIRVH